MSAGGTILLAGLGGAAGVLASDVIADAFYVRANRTHVAAAGAAVGAALAAVIGVAVTAADTKQKAGTLSGPPPQLRWP
jgi:uncharacterized protein (DUF2236 family)